MRHLLEAIDESNTQTTAVLRKLFLDKLPLQTRTILAASLETNLDSLALRADEVVAALSQTSSLSTAPPQQQLICKTFDQKLNKIIDALQTSNTRIQQQQPPRQKGGYRPNYYSNRQPFHGRFHDGPRQMHWPRLNTYNQQRYFEQPKNFQIRPRGSAASNRK